MKPGDRLGYDPWLHTPDAVDRFSKACAKVGAELAPLENNPIDAIWTDRPTEPVGSVIAHPQRWAGESASAKIARVQADLKAAEGLVVSDAHNVAWLFNIRGADVVHTPLPLSFAHVSKSGKPTLFVNSQNCPMPCEPVSPRWLTSRSPIAFWDLSARSAPTVRAWRSTPRRAPAILTQAFQRAGGEPAVGPDPITLMKACKNKVELAGARVAHVRDGAAMTRFLAWFEREAPRGGLTEISAAEALETFRRETRKLKDISFATIAAAGPHAAIPHYRVSEESNLKVEKGLFLIDSGGQYEDGTTDITRTIAVGKPSREMRDRFTRVLKGHIAIARAIFPKGTTGAQIDAFARAGPVARGTGF